MPLRQHAAADLPGQLEVLADDVREPRRVPAEAEGRVSLRLLDVHRQLDVDQVGAAQRDARGARAKVVRQTSQVDAHAPFADLDAAEERLLAQLSRAVAFDLAQVHRDPIQIAPGHVPSERLDESRADREHHLPTIGGGRSHERLLGGRLLEPLVETVVGVLERRHPGRIVLRGLRDATRERHGRHCENERRAPSPRRLDPRRTGCESGIHVDPERGAGPGRGPDRRRSTCSRKPGGCRSRPPRPASRVPGSAATAAPPERTCELGRRAASAAAERKPTYAGCRKPAR